MPDQASTANEHHLMIHRLLRLGSEHGIVVVLVLLCAFFSLVTLKDQTATGADAVAQVMGMLEGKAGVMIAVTDQPHDAAFADLMKNELQRSGKPVAAVVKGDPKAAREALQKLAAAGANIDAIVCHGASATWLVFNDLAADFPNLGNPPRIQPSSYRWPTFLKADNLLNIANQIAVIAILAIGMTMVVITSGIDLSVGSLIALSAVVTTLLIRDVFGGVTAGSGGMFIAAIGGISLCGLSGWLSGLLITRMSVPPFIVTLGVMLMASGTAYRLAENQSVYQVPDSFVWLGRGTDLLRLPNAVVLMLVLYAFAHGVMTQTRFGRYLYAVGGNVEAALLSGVPVRRVIITAYLICGLLAGLGGVVTASLLKSGSPTYGGMYELYVIAAVVVGGTRLSGGKGTIPGTLAGAFIIAVIQNGMNLTNVESNTQKIVLGLVILVAVLVDRLRGRSFS
jgi:ribose transport system permease protein